MTLRAADGAAADVHLHGAHVTSWRPANGSDERLYLSARSAFAPGQAIRGGIPVIFPQFAAEGPLPRHGFARTSLWTLGAVEQGNDGDAVATMHLDDSPATRALWPAAFRATLTVRVGGDRLVVALDVENRGAEPFAFAALLHTYLRVRDIARVKVHGLAGARYRESSAPGVLTRDDRASLAIAGEVDRVYVDTHSPVTVRDTDRATRVETTGFRDTVLWNPGPVRAAALADLDPGGEREMLCVEPGVVQEPVVLAPSARWRGVQTLVAE